MFNFLHQSYTGASHNRQHRPYYQQQHDKPQHHVPLGRPLHEVTNTYPQIAMKKPATTSGVSSRHQPIAIKKPATTSRVSSHHNHNMAIPGSQIHPYHHYQANYPLLGDVNNGHLNQNVNNNHHKLATHFVPPPVATAARCHSVHQPQVESKEHQPTSLAEAAVIFFSSNDNITLKAACGGDDNLAKQLARYIDKHEALKVMKNKSRGSGIRASAIKIINNISTSTEKIDLPPNMNDDIDCIGLNLDSVDNCPDKEFNLRNFSWNCSSRTWHSKCCHRTSFLPPSVLKAARWVNIDESNNRGQCPSCTNAADYAKRNHSKELDGTQNIKGRNDHIRTFQKEVKKLHELFMCSDSSRQECIQCLTEDSRFKVNMKVLATMGELDVICGGDLIRTCAGECCDEVMVVQARENNARLCLGCRKKEQNKARSEQTRKKNFYKQCRADSKTPNEYLTDEQKKLKAANLRKEINHLKYQSKRNEIIKRKLEEKVELEEGYDASDMNDRLDFMLDEFLANEGKLQENLRILLSKAVKIMNQTDGPEKENKDEEIESLVNTVHECMLNTSLKLKDKQKQCRYSPAMFQVAHAVWSTSPSAYKELTSLLPALSLPGIRHLQRSKEAAHVKDGRSPKPYQQRRATLDARNQKIDKGILQCDEMKLKHGIYWNTQTGEAVGLANDVLDIDSLMKRILSDEGDVPKAAVYVNQWQWISLTSSKGELETVSKLESVALNHFFNDGSLTGATLLNQFDYVVRSCESVGMEVYGLVLDAGGNNSKFRDLVLTKYSRLKTTDSWLDDDRCFFPNMVDPNRRIYLWFCSTHLLKALRGQQFSSKKELESVDGLPIGWYPSQLLDMVEAEKKKSGGKISSNIRLNEKAANPKNQLKMSVHLAKIPYEHNTLVFAMDNLLNELGITTEELERETHEARMKRPLKYITNEDSLKSKEGRLRHGDDLEKIKYLHKVGLEKHKHPATLKPLNIKISEDYDDEDCLFDEDEYFEEDDEEEEDGSESTRPQVQEKSGKDLLLSNLASLVYMGHIEALFHSLIMDRSERLTLDNIDMYEDHVKDMLKYFEDWKLAQLQRKAEGNRNWERTFIAPQTWKNLRICFSSFFHFSRYMLETVISPEDGITYIPMLLSNQSALEAKFSSQRRTGHDSNGSYSAGISVKSQRQANRTLTSKSAYCAEDTVGGEDNGGGAQVLGSTVMKAHYAKADEVLKQVKATRDDINKKKKNLETTLPETSTSRFGLPVDQKLNSRPECEALAANINGTSRLHFIDLLLKTDAIQGCIKLGLNREDMKKWIQDFVNCNDDEFDKACQGLLHKMYSFFEDCTFGSKKRYFEVLVREFCLSNGFKEFTHVDLPEPLRQNRLGALYIVDALCCLFESWVRDATSKVRSEKVEHLCSIDSAGMKDQMQRMVGFGLGKMLKKQEKATGIDDPLYILLKRMVYTEEEAIADKEYQEWYSQRLRLENKGFLHLIHPTFTGWASSLMVFCVNFYNKTNLSKNGSCVINACLEQLYKTESLLDKFKKSARTIYDVDIISDSSLETLHRKLAKCSAHAYSGFQIHEQFNQPKNKSNDTSNIAMRKLMQTTGSADGTSGKSSSKRKTEKRSVVQMLGVSQNKPSKKEGKRRTNTQLSDDEIKVIKEEYNNIYLTLTSTNTKMRERNYYRKSLSKKDCCVILWMKYKKFYNWKDRDQSRDDIHAIWKGLVEGKGNEENASLELVIVDTMNVQNVTAV